MLTTTTAASPQFYIMTTLHKDVCIDIYTLIRDTYRVPPRRR